LPAHLATIFETSGCPANTFHDLRIETDGKIEVKLSFDPFDLCRHDSAPPSYTLA
jgi:hypothetical protein